MKTLESPLDSKETKPVHPKGNQSWIFIGRTDAEGEAPILWPLDVKNWLIGKDPDAGKDWRWEEKGTTEDEMVGWHHWLDGREFEQTLEVWWWTGKPGVLQFMESQKVGLDWVTEWNWIELIHEKNFEISVIQNSCPVISKTIKRHQIQKKSEIRLISREA